MHETNQSGVSEKPMNNTFFSFHMFSLHMFCFVQSFTWKSNEYKIEWPDNVGDFPVVLLKLFHLYQVT